MTADREREIAVFQMQVETERITREAWQSMMDAGVTPHAAILVFLELCVFARLRELSLEDRAHIGALLEIFVEGHTGGGDP